jgi:type I restriction enzyme, S subunit
MTPIAWPLVPLGRLLTKSDNWITLEPERQYRELTVRLWGRGVVERRLASGAEIAADRRLEVRAGQFVLSRIDARNGAFGLVPDSLDRAIVSNDFPVFTPDPARITPQFLGWMSKTAGFVDLCKAASEGTTNRVRLKEDPACCENGLPGGQAAGVAGSRMTL